MRAASRSRAGRTARSAATFEADAITTQAILRAARFAAARPDDAALILGGPLHDTVEDCDGARADVAEAFGEDVATRVMEVTDDRSLPEAQRERAFDAAVAEARAAIARRG